MTRPSRRNKQLKNLMEEAHVFWYRFVVLHPDPSLARPSASVTDPLHFGTDPDPDLRISFFAYYVLLKGTFTSVFKNKTQKEVTK